MNYTQQLQQRLESRTSRSRLDANTLLEHFALISYAVPIERIEKLIPTPFKLWTYKKAEQEYAIVSAVPFLDKDFCFPKLVPFAKFQFSQTNFRTYIIDTRTGEMSAWFFSTILGSSTYLIPNKLWKMPWHFGRYVFEYAKEKGIYTNYKMTIKSHIGDAQIDIVDTGKKVELLEGFSSLEEQAFVLTHPVKGFYHRTDKTLGTYQIWHPEMHLTSCTVNHLYFGLFEKLGLLTKEEMMMPHSVLILPEIEFDVLLPPRKEKL